MELIILVILLVVVSIIAYNAVKTKNNKPLLEKTMSIDPNAEVKKDAITDDSAVTSSQFEYKPCFMVTLLRIVGVINAFGGIILGIVCGDEFGILIAVAVIFSGLMGWLFCFAFAKCVEAANKYLES